VSIREQTYRNIEWIIADGGSEDGTIGVINENEDIVSYWFREKDKGIYDAWNKASRFIHGNWVIFLGAGDVFSDKDSLTHFWQQAPDDVDKYAIVYGNTFMANADGSLRYLSRKPKLNHWEFGRIALPNHQGVFQNRFLFDTEKPFDDSYRIAGDSKFVIQALKRGEALHIDSTLSCMVDGGISNNVKNVYVGYEEVKRLCMELDIKVPFTHKVVNYIRAVVYEAGYKILRPKTRTFFKRIIDLIRKRK
jgi:glycosyltransferase involved in cell wall biosynthesis